MKNFGTKKVTFKNGLLVIIGLIIVASLVTGIAIRIFPVNKTSANQGNTSTEMQIIIPDNISQAAKTLVVQALPKIKRACPGLDKYANTLKYTGIEDMLDYNNLKKVTIVFAVPDNSSDIPNDYMAWGHNCFLDISADGTKLAIAKSACQSVCIDDVIDNSGKNLILNLN